MRTRGQAHAPDVAPFTARRTNLPAPSMHRTRLAAVRRPAFRAACLAPLALAAVRGAVAQRAPSAAPPPSDVRGGSAAFVAAVGADAVGRAAADPALGVAAHGGVEVRVGGPRSPIALRAGLDYGRSERAYQATTGYGPGPYAARRTTTSVGGGLAAVVRLPARGGVRPYALAGAGLQHYNRRDEGERVRLGPGASARVVYQPPVRANVAAYTAGVGATGRVGRVIPFAEVRVTALPALGAAGGARVRAPLVVGLRF